MFSPWETHNAEMISSIFQEVFEKFDIYFLQGHQYSMCKYIPKDKALNFETEFDCHPIRTNSWSSENTHSVYLSNRNHL